MVLELNTSDMGIVKRLNEVYPKLQALARKATTFDEKELADNSDEALAQFANKLDDIDKDMKKSDLERQSGITHYALGQLTRGKDVSTDTLGKICATLDCSIDDIMEFIPAEEEAK